MNKFAGWAGCALLLCAAPSALAQEASISEQAGAVGGSVLGTSAGTAAGGPVAGAVGGVIGGAIGKTTGKMVNAVLPWNWGKKKGEQQEAKAEPAPAAMDQATPASAHAGMATQRLDPPNPGPVLIDPPPPQG